MRLARQRYLFDVPDGITYLNCANLAPRLHAVGAAGEQALRRIARPWDIAPRDWFEGAERLRALFGRIVHADPDGVALVPSASYGVAVAAANLPVRPGQAIVLLDREFPSSVYAWRTLARQRGACIRTVARAPGQTWTEALLEAIGPDAAIVAAPNCHWTDGSLVDLVRVGAAVRKVGAALVVDASQSAGAHPLDVEAVRPDFLVTVGYKWLLGPYGLAYLYVAPHRRLGAPLEESWLSRAGSEDFSRLTEYTDAWRDGARRFDMGGFPQFLLTPMAIAALTQILAWGVEGIADSLSQLTDDVAAGSERLGGLVERKPHRVGHMIGVRLPGGVSGPQAKALAASRVFVSVRGDVLRVAPHLHNGPEDIARLLSLLAAS